MAPTLRSFRIAYAYQSRREYAEAATFVEASSEREARSVFRRMHGTAIDGRKFRILSVTEQTIAAAPDAQAADR